MDKALFVENVKKYCDQKGVKATNACRESGAGASLISNILNRGQTPSVEKVQALAQYLGVTTSDLLGETRPPLRPIPADVSNLGTVTLRDPFAQPYRPDYIHLTPEEVELMRKYQKAPPLIQQAVRGVLDSYAAAQKGESAG